MRRRDRPDPRQAGVLSGSPALSQILDKIAASWYKTRTLRPSRTVVIVVSKPNFCASGSAKTDTIKFTDALVKLTFPDARMGLAAGRIRRHSRCYCGNLHLALLRRRIATERQSESWRPRRRYRAAPLTPPGAGRAVPKQLRRFKPSLRDRVYGNNAPHGFLYARRTRHRGGSAAHHRVDVRLAGRPGAAAPLITARRVLAAFPLQKQPAAASEEGSARLFFSLYLTGGTDRPPLTSLRGSARPSAQRS